MTRQICHISNCVYGLRGGAAEERVEKLELAIRNYIAARDDLEGGGASQIDACSRAYLALKSSLTAGSVDFDGTNDLLPDNGTLDVAAAWACKLCNQPIAVSTWRRSDGTLASRWLCGCPAPNESEGSDG